MKNLNLALKLLWRDCRSGELTLLALALLIAVSSSTTISLFADRLHRTMISQAAEFMAADLAIASPNLIANEWLAKAAELGLTDSQTCEFSSVLLENQDMLLASVKAASDKYPLRGHLKTLTADELDETTSQHGLEPGTVWVEKRVLSALNLKLGEQIKVGEKALTIAAILSYEPDKRANFYNYSPRVMMHLADLPATGVVQPGSRVFYGYQFTGSETALNSFRDWVKPQLTASQRLMDIHQDRPELDAALSRAEQYMGLSSILVVLVSGVAIAISTRRFSERHFNTTALLRCLGCRQAQLFKLYVWQFLILGLLISGLGCALGWLAQNGLFQALQTLLPPYLSQPGIAAYFLGIGTGMAILLGFALPPLLTLQRVSPLRVLRRDLAPLPPSSWLVYSLALTLTGLLIWRYSHDVKMTGIILLVSLLALLLLSLLVYGLMTMAGKRLNAVSLRWRFGLQSLLRNKATSIGQILALSITLTAMAVSYTVRNDVLENWHKQLPAQAPNHFALNILPDQQAAFQSYLETANIASSRFYPVSRGRLVSINNDPVQRRASKNSQGEAAIQRELSLTWTAVLPEDNKIIAGEPWQANQPNQVSVEEKLAENLDIHPGDVLSFSIGNEAINAIVVNLRHLQWDTMRPNFYMIFSPGTLDNFAATFITSFYLPKDQKALLNGLLKKFPATTILEADQILRQFENILKQLTKAIDLLLYFALMSGFTVLLATVYASMDQRIHETALLRTLGASVSTLRTSNIIEFAVLGTLTGSLATVATEAILYLLYTQVMHISYVPSFYLWAALPVIAALAVSLAGNMGMRKVFRHAPLPILRRVQ